MTRVRRHKGRAGLPFNEQTMARVPVLIEEVA